MNLDPLPCTLVHDDTERRWLRRWIFADRLQWFCIGWLVCFVLRALGMI